MAIRSFDSNGDGIGDLPGITSKVGTIKDARVVPEQYTNRAIY
jgi:glycosidase